MEKLTVQEFSSKIADKRDLYEACLRNGWYLPSLKSSIVTESYLMGVIDGRLWCPKFSDIRLLPCTRPPSKDILLYKLLRMLELKVQVPHGIDENHVPNKRWLLDALSTLSPEDEIFAKDY